MLASQSSRDAVSQNRVPAAQSTRTTAPYSAQPSRPARRGFVKPRYGPRYDPPEAPKFCFPLPLLVSGSSWWNRPVSLAPLAGFRLGFGLLVFGATVRFWAHGWIEELYVRQRFFFGYYGFEWLPRLPAVGLYTIFGLLALSALGVALGAWYRISTAVLFIMFSYVELLDKANYLNHYYYVTMVLALLALLPAHRGWSVDAWRRGAAWAWPTLPAWMLVAVKVQVASVYFFGGVAKIKTDWLLHAQPLKIWLAANATLPLVGPLLDDAWVAYAVAWFACVFDLTVPFFLWRDRTRPWAYAVVVAFHLLTAKLFYIGIFPWAMLVSTWIFFRPESHQRVLGWLWPVAAIPAETDAPADHRPAARRRRHLAALSVAALLLVQLVLPFRYLRYPGNVLWTEQGFRYSWNIMLIEKAGTVDFHLRDTATGRTWTVDPRRYLSRQQARMLSTQPDMMVQFAHFLAREERRAAPLEVRAEAWVTLNGRPSQLLVDPTVDLVRETDSFAPKTWILPLTSSAR